MGRSLLLSRRHLFGPPLNLEFGHVTWFCQWAVSKLDTDALRCALGLVCLHTRCYITKYVLPCWWGHVGKRCGVGNQLLQQGQSGASWLPLLNVRLGSEAELPVDRRLWEAPEELRGGKWCPAVRYVQCLGPGGTVHRRYGARSLVFGCSAETHTIFEVKTAQYHWLMILFNQFTNRFQFKITFQRNVWHSESYSEVHLKEWTCENIHMGKTVTVLMFFLIVFIMLHLCAKTHQTGKKFSFKNAP